MPAIRKQLISSPAPHFSPHFLFSSLQKQVRNTVSSKIALLTIPHFFPHFLIFIVLVNNHKFLPVAGNQAILL